MGVTVEKVYGGGAITLTYEDVPLWDSDRARALLQKLGREYMELTLLDLGGAISDAAPVGVSGHLAQSWGGDAEFGGRDIKDVAGGIDGRVFSSLPYAIVIDQGRTPGARMPPVEAIKLWVERVLGADADEAESIAWAVAKSIAKKGIDARHYVDAGVEAALPRIREIWDAFAAAMAAGLAGDELRNTK